MGDYTRFMEEEFPYFLQMGMSYELYWRGDPELVNAYARAGQLRRQQVSDDAWLMGAYVFQALDAVAHNLTRKKGQRPREYPEEPMRVIPYTQAEEQARAEKERRRVIAFFDKMAQDAGKRKSNIEGA